MRRKKARREAPVLATADFGATVSGGAGVAEKRSKCGKCGGAGGCLRGKLPGRSEKRAVLVGRDLGTAVVVGDELEGTNRELDVAARSGRTVGPQVAAPRKDKEIDEPGRHQRAHPVALRRGTRPAGRVATRLQ